jgi:CMP-N-acetylneuraminate monooxygenase
MNVKFGRQLKNKSSIKIQKIPHPHCDDFITHEDLILGKTGGKWIAYDRVCDHNGGTLNLDEGKKTATCPIHKWTLKLNEQRYENNCEKAPLEVIENESYLEVKRVIYEFDDLETESLVDSKIDLNFNAHASITLTINNIKLTSDPWYLGSCFATGWWHSNPPSEEAIERLKNSDFIYISHNHPDHLHIPTLEKLVAKETPIIVPNFESRSVELILLRLGYKNLIIADFLKELEIETSKGKFRLVVIKSGDTRDDSALLILTKKNKVFLGVDANMPNRWVLPSVDVLYTPFAGGSSGFPSRIENFSLERKKEIIRSNRLSILHSHVKNLVTATAPKYVIPYAGYFTESYLDDDVRVINKKNTADELIAYVENQFLGVVGINPLINPHLTLYRDDFLIDDKNETPDYFVDDEYVDQDVKSFSADMHISDSLLIAVGEQYIKSKFYDDLIVVFLPCDEKISLPVSKSLVVDFSTKDRSFKLIESKNLETDEDILKALGEYSSSHVEILRVRASSFAGAILRGLPLEDLSIGFQIRMFRHPNLYNYSFWNHFTNIEFIKVPSC